MILKGEIVDPRNKMCDCLVFRSDGKIVLVELKSTVQHAQKIAEKFKKSITASLNIASEAGSRPNRVVLVLLAKRHGRTVESHWIKHQRLKHGNDTYPIHLGSCGDLMSKFVD